MKRMHPCFGLLLLLLLAGTARPACAREPLTDKEIEKIRDSYDIDKRMKVFMEAAELRLKSAEDRLNGEESEPGDPLEFFTPEDMLDSYYRIIRSAMMNLDEAAERPRRGDPSRTGDMEQRSPRDMITAALKALDAGTEKAARRLEILKKIAEEKNKEELWHLVNSAIDITNGAHDGAEYGLSKYSSPKKK